MPHYDALILTVGMQAAPVVFSLQQCEARYAAFVCTPQSERQTLPKVLDAVNLSAANWRKCVVADEPSQIGHLCLEMHQAYRWLRETCGVSAESIGADPTAGRKWMSAGGTMIAAFLGLPMLYIDAKYPDGKIDLDSMALVALGNAYDQTGFVEAETGRRHFNEGNFAAAAEIFDKIRPTISTQFDLYAGLAGIARALDRWDRFEHCQQSLQSDFDRALVSLNRHLDSVIDGTAPLRDFAAGMKALAAAIESLPRDNPLGNCGFTVDVYLNSRRCIARQRWDDSCSRLYRVLEALSQFLLKKEFGFDTAKPDYERFQADDRAKIEQYCERLPRPVALDNGWKVLLALGHQHAGSVLKTKGAGKLQNTFSGLLELRDHSILAHGFKPIGREKVEEFATRIENLLRQTLSADFESWARRLEYPQLCRLL